MNTLTSPASVVASMRSKVSVRMIGGAGTSPAIIAVSMSQAAHTAETANNRRELAVGTQVRRRRQLIGRRHQPDRAAVAGLDAIGEVCRTA
jgi:hypothetical protein